MVKYKTQAPWEHFNVPVERPEPTNYDSYIGPIDLVLGMLFDCEIQKTCRAKTKHQVEGVIKRDIGRLEKINFSNPEAKEYFKSCLACAAALMRSSVKSK
ncbi:MAG: hypothetical protein LBO78_03340 [Rickettsiales bacterium]|jgi:hypothetical protein|nr:hypothetical protein [Rickettsiales bacterium]